MTTLGYLLREHRLKLDLTQEDVASQVGVTQGQVSQWEHNKRKPDYEELKKLSEVLDAPFTKLIDRNIGLATDVQRAIVDDSQLSRRDQDIMLGVYQAMTGQIADIAKLLRGEWPIESTD